MNKRTLRVHQVKLVLFRIAFNHLVFRLKACLRELERVVALVRSLCSRRERRVRDQRKVNSRVGHEIRLKLGEIDVEVAFESERGGDTGDDLTQQTVKVDVRRSLDAEVVSPC